MIAHKLRLVVQRVGEVVFNMVVTHVPSHAVRKGYLRLWGARIGRRSYILRGTTVIAPQGIRIGERCNIGFRCLLDARGGITIGDNVVVASDTHFLGGIHEVNDPEFRAVLRPIHLEDYVWVASRATIMSGVTLGRGAVVAGCACVTADVPPLAMVGGVPAKRIGTREEEALRYDPSWYPLLY